ncbi:MAG TPA: hypothetical protein V6C91_16840 [Coleofasciculaceae cyanobacterium]
MRSLLKSATYRLCLIMQQLFKTNRQSQQMVAALVLTSILSLGTSLTFVDAAAANSVGKFQGITNLKQSRTNQLPNSVINAIRRDIASRTQSPRGQWRVIDYTQQSWPDGCLGLSNPDESCTRILVENGWRVVMSNGRQTVTYRTDATGRIVRMENQDSSGNPGTPNPSDLPRSVNRAVLQDASQRTGLRPNQLRIVQFERREWSDGCLGLGRPDFGCMAVIVPGWQVMVESGQQRLVYRTNESGSQVVLDEQASTIGEADLPSSVTNAVLRTASERTGLRPSELRIIDTQQIQGSSSCLGIPPRPGEACTEDLARLWQVTVAARQQRLVYHTDLRGSRIRLNEAASNISDNNTGLPSAIANIVLQEASRQLRLPTSALRIAQAQQQTWTNSCLDLQTPVERCMGVMTPGWRVTVGGGPIPLVYHTDDNGSRIRLNKGLGDMGGTDLPQPVADAVLAVASERTGLSTSELRILRSQQFVGSSSCLGLPARPGEGCTKDLVPLWQVTVLARGQQPLVYHTDVNGSRIRLNEAASNLGDANVPDSVANAVLQAASQRTGLRPSELRIVKSQQIRGSSSCLGVPTPPNEACTRDNVPIWQVTVEGRRQRLVYHTNLEGTRIRLNETASGIGDGNVPDIVDREVLQGVPIPSSELPPPLPQNAIFRVITSGGFAGRTEETILLNNGQMITRSLISSGAGSTPTVTSVSPERLQQFKRLLEQQPMAKYYGLNYPAPTGAADYMSVTLTSNEGTIRYADMVQGQLPKPLQIVMLMWNMMGRGR